MSTLSVVGSTPDYPVPVTPPVSGSPLPPADQPIPRLIGQHGAALLRFTLKLALGDHERAQDIYQETLIRAWKHPELCQENVFASRRWLFTVARHVLIDQLRASAIRPALVGDEQRLTEARDPEDQIGKLLLAKEVRAAIKTLSPAHREVLREVYFEDCTVAQAAEHLGIPVGTAKSRIYYALRALKVALAARGMDRSLAESA